MSVSVLIPAFRPTYLRQAIASVLTQGVEDLELVISDDSAAEAVRAVVEQFGDLRIRYVSTGGRVGPGGNLRRLWGEAKFERMLFLLDDDILLPHALVELAARLDEHPHAAFAFGARHVVDERGAILRDAESPISEPTLLSPTSIVLSLLPRLANPFGELSNVLINRATGLTADDLLLYAGYEMHVDADVGFFLNASRKGPAAATHRTVGGFRRHAAQNSSPTFNPSFALGICEWELFTRGEFASGRLSVDQAQEAVTKLVQAYRNWSPKLPDIALMAQGLEALSERIACDDRDVLDTAFEGTWIRLVEAVHRRAPPAWKMSPTG